jgi:transposase InsO family protein
MSLARLVVTAVRMQGRSKSEVARDYRVSRQWVHELVRRFDAEGEAGLEPRSRRPRGSPRRTPTELENEIVELRKLLADEGLDAGAHTIAYHLQSRHGCCPSVATIWRILSRRGFVTPQPQKRPKSSFIRFEAAQPNERWQADITHWRLGNGNGVEILNILDDHSRSLIASDAMQVFKAGDVVATFHRAFAAQGFPASVLTDNGAVFTAAPRHGRCAMETELETLGISYRHSTPYHPQTCGKVERFHQTLKRYLARQLKAESLGELQEQIEVFAIYYNTCRPHRSLGRRTPAQVYDARPKATPSPPAERLPGHCRVRRDRIDTTGVITLRHRSRMHHVGLGRRYAGVRVLVLVADLHVRVITEDGELLRELTLDPDRDYQRQHG